MKDDKLIINGQPVGTTDLGQYDDGCYEGMHLSAEQLGKHHHQILFCPTPGDINAEPLPTCNRRDCACAAESDQRLEMMIRDARVYGALLAKQRDEDLTCTDHCFMSKHRKKV